MQTMTLADAEIQAPVVVEEVGGERAFRRRLMELGLLPGTSVAVVRVAPLGDPLELSVRGSRISIRRAEARAIVVRPHRAAAPELAHASAPRASASSATP
jgi:ferrous iron transport protein A